MNILLVCHTKSYGGIESQLVLLSRELVKRGDNVMLAAPQGSWLFDKCLREEKIRCVHTPFHGLFDPISHLLLIYFIYRFDIDIVHSHTRRSSFYGAVASKITGRKSVSTVHSLHTWKQFNLNNKIIAVSEAVKNYLIEKNIDPKKIEVIYNGVPVPKMTIPDQRKKIRTRLSLAKTDIAICMSGRTVRHKGHDLLIEALSLLNDQFPNVHVYFLGETHGDWYLNLKQKINQIELDENIHFLGYQDNVLEILSAMDIFVLPSLTEALSMSLIEALSIGLSAVATRIDGIPEVILEGENGLLFTKGNSNELALKLKILIKNPDLCAAYSKHATQTHRKRFLDKFMVDSTRRVYLEQLSHL